MRTHTHAHACTHNLTRCWGTQSEVHRVAHSLPPTHTPIPDTHRNPAPPFPTPPPPTLKASRQLPRACPALLSSRMLSLPCQSSMPGGPEQATGAASMAGSISASASTQNSAGRGARGVLLG